LLQAAAHRASGDIGLFTFAQAIVLTLALGALTLRLAGPRATTVIFPVILVMPTVWPWVFVQVSDIPIAAGLAMAAWAILALSGTPGGSARFAWSFFILFCSTVLILGSRSNTPALLPVVIMLVYLSCKHLRRKIIAIASVLTALAATMLMQSLLADTSYNRLSDVIAWEYVLTLKELADPQALEVYNLDSIGQTRIAVRMARYDRHDSLVFGSSPPLPSEKLRLQSYRVFSGFANLVSQYPREYLSAKLKIHRQLLALDNTVRYKLFTADHPRIKWRGGAVYRPLIPHFGDNLAASVGSLDVLNPLYLPYANLIICLVLAGIALVVDSDRRWPYAVVLALAVGNYGIFFLITPAATFRYFLPTHILFLVVSLDALTALAVRIRQRLAGVFEDVS